MSDSLRARTVRNIAYNAGARVVILIAQLVASITLARNLSSSDYGIFGFATIFINFLAPVAEFGTTSAAVQQSSFRDENLYTGFTIKVAMGLATFVLALFVAPVAAHIFDDPAVVNVIRLLAVAFLVNNLFFLPSIVVMRKLDYGKLVLSQVGLALVSLILTVVLVRHGFRYWSIAVASVGSATASAIILNLLVRVRPAFRFDRPIAAAYLRFGGSVVLSGLVVFTMLNVDNFMIGTVTGAAQLGFYALAFNWGARFCDLLSVIVHSVLYPTFARVKDDPEKLRRAYLQVVEMTSVLAIVAYVSLLAVSRDFLYFVLGHGTDKWLPALAALRIMCLYGIVRAILEPVGTVVLALGKPGIQLRANILAASVELALLYPALRWFGIEGVAAVVTFSFALQYFVYLPALRRTVGLRFGDFLRAVRPAAGAGILILALGLAFTGGDVLRFNLANFVLKAAGCAGGFLLIHGLLSRWRVLGEFRGMVRSLRA